MPAEDFDPLDPDMPDFEFGRFLFARPAGDSAVCLFAQREDLLLLVEYTADQHESASSSSISELGAQTVDDLQYLAITGLIKPGESVRGAWLDDGTELMVVQKRPGWMIITDPVTRDITVTVSLQTPTGITEQSLRIPYYEADY